MCYTFDRCPHVLEEFLSNTRLNFLYFLVELWVQFLLSGSSPVWTLFTTVQLIPFDISPHCSILLYSLIERCCAPAYKGGTKGDTTKLSIFFHRHHSISISESLFYNSYFNYNCRCDLLYPYVILGIWAGWLFLRQTVWICQLLRSTAKIFGPFTAYGKRHRDSVFAYSLCCFVGRRHVVSNHYHTL